MTELNGSRHLTTVLRFILFKLIIWFMASGEDTFGCFKVLLVTEKGLNQKVHGITVLNAIWFKFCS